MLLQFDALRRTGMQPNGRNQWRSPPTRKPWELVGEETITGVMPRKTRYVNRALVLYSDKTPAMPCHPARARTLLRDGKAAVYRRVPFTIVLTERASGDAQPLELRADPGSKTTGLALVAAFKRGDTVVFAAELTHRGSQIRKAIRQRAACRRRRRNANLRHRPARFDNRTRRDGWLPPSLQSRVDNVLAWAQRLQRFAPLSNIAVETVRFDMQAMQNPEISGIEYQQGTLAGYEVREYLLEKWGRACAYCDAENVPLQIDHVAPKSRGGSNRVSNLTLACEPCNTAKGNMPVDDFLAADPARLKRILAQLKTPLRDAAAVNATRWALLHALQSTGLPVETDSGGRTKYNRSRLRLPKTHAIDAACVGNMDAVATVAGVEQPTLTIKACGRGAYQRTIVTAHGFPRGYRMRTKRVCGFATGDRVRAIVPSGARPGVHVGRVAVRASGSFNIQTVHGTVQGINAKHCRLVQRADGYAYNLRKEPPLLSGLNARVSAA